jgi:hypothetical protein
MIIDVLVSSCARPDMLETSIMSFRRHIKTEKHEYRWVIIEDKIGSRERRKEGEEWIRKHRHLFDKKIFLRRKAGVGYWWQKAIEQCESDFHIHLEDDNEFLGHIMIDPLINIMSEKSDIIEIMFSRGLVRADNNPKRIMLSGVIFTENDLMSIATGVFNTKLVRILLDTVGWGEKVKEHGTLTPATKKLGFRKLVLGENGEDNIHYLHVGADLGLRKGAWKK